MKQKRILSLLKTQVYLYISQCMQRQLNEAKMSFSKCFADKMVISQLFNLIFPHFHLFIFKPVYTSHISQCFFDIMRTSGARVDFPRFSLASEIMGRASSNKELLSRQIERARAKFDGKTRACFMEKHRVYFIFRKALNP